MQEGKRFPGTGRTKNSHYIYLFPCSVFSPAKGAKNSVKFWGRIPGFLVFLAHAENSGKSPEKLQCLCPLGSPGIPGKADKKFPHLHFLNLCAKKAGAFDLNDFWFS